MNSFEVDVDRRKNDMQFYMPTKLYSEQDCVKSHGDVEIVLKNEEIQYTIFDDVEENPSIETIMKARDIGLRENVDFVIGIGGGSPMDAAKAIALMIANPQETEEV